MVDMFFIREEVENDGIWDGGDDVEDTSEVGVSTVRIVCGGLVVFGFSNVDFGYALGISRRRIWAS